MDVSKRKRSRLLDQLNIMFTVFRSLNFNHNNFTDIILLYR